MARFYTLKSVLNSTWLSFISQYATRNSNNIFIDFNLIFLNKLSNILSRVAVTTQRQVHIEQKLSKSLLLRWDGPFRAYFKLLLGVSNRDYDSNAKSVSLNILYFFPLSNAICRIRIGDCSADIWEFQKCKNENRCTHPRKYHVFVYEQTRFS